MSHISNNKVTGPRGSKRSNICLGLVPWAPVTLDLRTIQDNPSCGTMHQVSIFCQKECLDWEVTVQLFHGWLSSEIDFSPIFNGLCPTQFSQVAVKRYLNNN